jgi:Phage tail sheath protein subtilisin-like domain
VPVNLAQTFLAGGTNPPPTVQDWLNGLDVITRQDLVGGLVFPVTTDPIMQDAVNAWVSEQHTNAGKAFRGFYAPPDFTSTEDAKSMAMGLNSTLAAMIPQAIIAASGATEQQPLYPVACYCGAAAGALPTQPVTRLVVRARGLPDRAKFSKAMREDLLNNGVAVLEEVRGVGVRVSLAITTSLSQDRIDRMLSESMARDVIDQRIRAHVEPLIPHWAMWDFMPQVKGSVFNALTTLETDGIISKGRDANGRILPAWLPIQVSIHAGTMKITVHVFLGGEIDHINVNGTLSYQQFEIEIPASV